ncbi:MAG: hypothetical protein AAF570_04375, partial [Bacteroidota bacterium]
MGSSFNFVVMKVIYSVFVVWMSGLSMWVGCGSAKGQSVAQKLDSIFGVVRDVGREDPELGLEKASWAMNLAARA